MIDSCLGMKYVGIIIGMNFEPKYDKSSIRYSAI